MEAKKEPCEFCEREFDRAELDVIQLDSRSYVCCNICSLTEQLGFYKKRYERAQNSVEALKVELDLFRQICLRPETMEGMANDPMETPIRWHIKQRESGWETMPLDTILHWLKIFQAYAEKFSEIATRRNGKESIQSALKEHTRRKMEEVEKIRNTAEVQKKDPEVRKVLSQEDKAVKGMMKSLGVSESLARTMLNASLSQFKKKE